MAWAGRELAVVHGPHLATERLLRDGQAELIPDPLHQVDQAPAHHAVDGRDGPLLEHVAQRRPLGRIQNGFATRGLSVDEPVGAVFVEAQHPVAHDLQPHPGELGRVGSGVSVVDGGERQEAPGLIGVARALGEGAQRCGIEVGAQGDGSGHGDLGRRHTAANHVAAAKAISAMRRPPRGVVFVVTGPTNG